MTLKVKMDKMRVDGYQIDGEPEIHMIFGHEMYTDEYMASAITIMGKDHLIKLRNAINEALGE